MQLKRSRPHNKIINRLLITINSNRNQRTNNHLESLISLSKRKKNQLIKGLRKVIKQHLRARYLLTVNYLNRLMGLLIAIKNSLRYLIQNQQIYLKMLEEALMKIQQMPKIFLLKKSNLEIMLTEGAVKFHLKKMLTKEQKSWWKRKEEKRRRKRKD